MPVALLITGEILADDGVPCIGVADGGAIDVTTIVLDSFPTFDTSLACDIAENNNTDVADSQLFFKITTLIFSCLKFTETSFAVHSKSESSI